MTSNPELSPTWQPFDTAPKSGNQILVWREDAGIFIASYGWIGHLSGSGVGFDADGKTLGHCWFSSDGEDLSGDLPVFWMPLPDEPDDRRPLVLDLPHWIWGRAEHNENDAPVCSKCGKAINPDGTGEHKRQCWNEGGAS